MSNDEGCYSFRDYHMFLLTRYSYVCGFVSVGALLRPEQFDMSQSFIHKYKLSLNNCD